MAVHMEAVSGDTVSGKGVQFGDAPMKLVVRHTFLELENDQHGLSPTTSSHLQSEMKRRAKSDTHAMPFKWTGLDWDDSEGAHTEVVEQSDSDTTASGPGTGNTSLNSENNGYRAQSSSDLDTYFALDAELGQGCDVAAAQLTAALTPKSPYHQYFGTPHSCHDASFFMPYPEPDMSFLSDASPSAYGDASSCAYEASTSSQQPMWDNAFGQQLMSQWAPRPAGCDASLATHTAQLELEAAQLKVAALQAEIAAQRARAQSAGFPPSVGDQTDVASTGWPQVASSLFVPPVPPFMQMPQGWSASGTTTTASDGDVHEKDASICLAHALQKDGVSSPHAERRQNQGRAKSDTTYTTVMLRNLPNDYTRDMLLEFLDTRGFIGCYDFAYLPVDFKRKAGLGYAFVNFITHEDAERAKRDLQGFSDWKVYSQKVLQVAWSTPLQGLAANIDRYRNSPVMHPDVPDEFRPLLFNSGRPVPFPPPTRHIPPPTK